jgi:hypothetical protein
MAELFHMLHGGAWVALALPALLGVRCFLRIVGPAIEHREEQLAMHYKRLREKEMLVAHVVRQTADDYGVS